MPKKRAERERTQAAPVAPEKVVMPTGAFSQYTDHLRCPCCGLMARIEPDAKRRTESKSRIPSLKEGPYESYFRRQEYGGSEETETIGKHERRKGNMKWGERRELETEERALLIRNLRQALAYIENGLTLPQEPSHALKIVNKQAIAPAISPGRDLKEFIIKIKETLDEDRKAVSLKKIEKLLDDLDTNERSEIYGVEDLEAAIEEYRDAERADKEDAWEGVVSTVEDFGAEEDEI